MHLWSLFLCHPLPFKPLGIDIKGIWSSHIPFQSSKVWYNVSISLSLNCQKKALAFVIKRWFCSYCFWHRLACRNLWINTLSFIVKSHFISSNVNLVSPSQWTKFGNHSRRRVTSGNFCNDRQITTKTIDFVLPFV